MQAHLDFPSLCVHEAVHFVGNKAQGIIAAVFPRALKDGRELSVAVIGN